MNNNNIRILTQNYIKRYGATYSFLARKLGVSCNTVRLFALGERDLSQSKLETLREYMGNSTNEFQKVLSGSLV